VMVYAQCYVINNGADKEVNAGISSDDSVQVILNGDEVWVHSIPRGGASACGPQDITPDGVTFTNKLLLKHGENNLIVKTFEGGGGWNHSFRFQDDSGAAFTQDLDVKLEPSGVCIKPAMTAVRSIDTGETVLVQGKTFPKYSDGKTYDVSIAISNPRATNGPCSPPGTITLVEATPTGWVPSNASNGGVINSNVITFSLNGASLPSSLTYKVKAVGTAPEASIGGLFSDAGALGKYVVSGAGLLFNPTDFTDQGFIKTWLLLGPYSQPAGLGANPGAANIRKDHLTDEGANKELTIQPKAGDTIQTHYGPPTCAPEGTPGCKSPPKARSIGLAPPATANGINPGGIPTWAEWRDRHDTINFNDYYGGDLSHVMMYAVTYVKVDRDIPIAIGLGSDDSIQVLLDGQEIWLCNLPRGSDGNNAIQDVIAADPAQRSSTVGPNPGCDVGTDIITQLDPLTAGCHELMVKVFEGGGGHEFRLRFQDPGSGDPITDGLSIFLKPDCTSGQPVGPLFHRGDAAATAPWSLPVALGF